MIVGKADNFDSIDFEVCPEIHVENSGRVSDVIFATIPGEIPEGISGKKFGVIPGRVPG